MANIRDIRRRIRSVKNTRQITKAMKMVSAAKLRRAQERALASRPYCADAYQRAAVAGQPHRSGRREDRRAQAPAAGATAGEEHPAGAGHRRSRTGRRLQLERAESGSQVPRGFQGQEHRASRRLAARVATTCAGVIRWRLPEATTRAGRDPDCRRAPEPAGQAASTRRWPRSSNE